MKHKSTISERQNQKKVLINKEIKNFLPISSGQTEALEEQILNDGKILFPLIMGRYKNNKSKPFLIDGHNRYDIALKHNLTYETSEPIDFETEGDVYQWLYNHQTKRRDWNEWQRFEAVQILKIKLAEIGKLKYKETVGRPKKSKSNPTKNSEPHNTRKTIAEELGWGRTQVGRADKILKHAPPEIIEELRLNKMTINKAHEIIQKKIDDDNRRISAEKGKLVSLPERINLKFGDFNIVLDSIEDNSIDLILTDPAYPKEYLHTWRELADFAQRKLKPSGLMIAYSGQYHLPKVLQMLGKKLHYYWPFCLEHKGKTQIVNHKNVMCGWKPILIYQKAPKRKFDQTILDVIGGGKRQKKHHVWEQDTTGFKQLMELFSHENDLICDPFVGGGTVPYLCKKLNRRFVGAEIDEQSYNISLNRINEEPKVKTKTSDTKRKVVYHSVDLCKPRERFIFPDNYKKAA